MPFYKRSEIKEISLPEQPTAVFQNLSGELIKVGFVTYTKGNIRTPHYHVNEEEFTYMIEGSQFMILGEEEALVEEGDLVHTPKGTVHSGIIVAEKTVMFVTKSPAGDGNMAQDFKEAGNAEELIFRLKEKYKELTSNY